MSAKEADLVERRIRAAWMEAGGTADQIVERPCEPGDDPLRFAEHMRFLAGQCRTVGLVLLADQADFAAAQLVEFGPAPARFGTRGSVIEQHGNGLVRVLPAVTDDDLTRAVLQAKAVVELDRRADTLRYEVQKRDATIQLLRDQARDSEAGHRKLLDRLLAVQRLHTEAWEHDCADGCCEKGLGVCQFCGEPWPCRTYRVADGKEP